MARVKEAQDAAREEVREGRYNYHEANSVKMIFTTQSLVNYVIYSIGGKYYART